MRLTASIAIGALLMRARSKNLRRACAQHAASMIGPGLRRGLVEPVEAGIGVRLHQAGVARQMLLGMLAAAVGASRRRPPPADRGRRTAGRRAHRSIAGRCGSCPWPAPARWCRRHGCARPRRHACGSPRPAASAWPPRRRPSRPASRRRARCLRAHRPSLWRLSGRCRPYLANRMWASRPGPARPRAIGCEGAGGCVIASQARQENFSRTCWITFHWRGTSSSVSVTSSPSLCKVAPPQHGQAAGSRIDDALARQMLGQRPARRLAPFERRHLDCCARRGCRDLCRRLGLRGILFKLGQLQARAARAARRAPTDWPNRSCRSLAIVNLSFSISTARYCASLCAASRAARSATSIAFNVATSSGSESSMLIAAERITERSACLTRRSARRFKMPRSAGRLRSPGVLRQPPVDPFQQIAELRRRDRHHRHPPATAR